jgi:hypothetical protein
MKKLSSLAALALLLLGSLSGRAQYTFTASSLGPYQQNFDAIPSTGIVSFTNGTNASLPGIIAGYNAGVFGSSPPAAASNGSASTGSTPFHFGTTGATDRALGAITGSVASTPVTGYIAVRLRNSSGLTIHNFDVRYALEQWFNSANAQDAYVRVAYRTYSTTTAFTNNDLTSTTGWTAVPDLDLQAPATGGVTGPADGNSPTYRRVTQKRLTGIELANDQELVIRFSYIFYSATNGNGVSLDDIVIYPETNVLYAKATGDLNSTDTGAAATWTLDADGTTSPASIYFAAANYTYYVQGSNAASRLSGPWAVTGANSRVVVGTESSPATLLLTDTDDVTATLEVNKGSVLQLGNTPAGLQLGALASSSTVQYQGDAAATAQAVLPATYGALVCSGSSHKTLIGTALVAGNLSLSGGTAPQALHLGNYNLTLLRGATLTRSNGQVVTDGSGEYRATVTKASSGGSAVLFPVAVSGTAADYLPATLTAGSSDLDETFRVRVGDGVYRTYSGTGVGTGASASHDNVKATWHISRETTTPVSATLKLGWAAGREGSTFVRNQAYISHYTAGRWEQQQENAGSFADDGQYAAQRTGISSFSPFTITSNAAGPLPVQLVAFTARRSNAAVRCAWQTASERNSAYFVVERSLDGTTFKVLGRVEAAGSSSTVHDYAFTDQQPASTQSYYRLRQVDADGRAALSPVVAIAGRAAGLAMTAIPNPSDGRITLLATLPSAARLSGTVVNALGQTVLTFCQALAAGASSLPLDLSNQPAGVYVVQLQGPDGTRTLRLLKQ